MVLNRDMAGCFRKYLPYNYIKKNIFPHGKIFSIKENKFGRSFLLLKICFHEKKYFSMRENVFLQRNIFFVISIFPSWSAQVL
jgi:hypothetical protein